jgi:tetratricopeptide (TPR) repeat protein
MESDGEDFSSFADAGPDDEFDGDIDALATAFMSRAKSSAATSPRFESEEPRKQDERSNDDLLSVEAQHFFEAASASTPLPVSAATAHLNSGADSNTSPASAAENLSSQQTVEAGSFTVTGDAEAPEEIAEGPQSWPDLTFTDGRVISRRKRSIDETTELEAEKKNVDMATACKEEGNRNFSGGNYATAIACYTEALRFAPLDETFNAQRAIYYCNRAACHLQLGDAEEALYDCDRALELNATYNKALARRAAAMEKLEKLDEALAGMSMHETCEYPFIPGTACHAQIWSCGRLRSQHQLLPSRESNA